MTAPAKICITVAWMNFGVSLTVLGRVTKKARVVITAKDTQ